MAAKLKKTILMTLIWTSTGLAFSNLIKPPKFSMFLKIFTNTYSSTTLKRFQAINTILKSIFKVNMVRLDIFAIKFAGLLLVVLDSLLRSQKVYKDGDVFNANLICAMHVCKLQSIWTLFTI
jgi:hypothetical protein